MKLEFSSHFMVINLESELNGIQVTGDIGATMASLSLGYNF